ncbi:hypothetical protein COCCADRAFT_96725 [Bipolaris zeicola 26-R-13]|uniref:Uncharacterized protein n=1 Tax=Cochliobolus carbonum (strain 26-R-13) TaxID=930089 RepID=W6YCF7_COCC2|nr:uncharacterized protein COCCADRAFT_96725 [Bipolaris zeicola 26-R-13]EUC33194.1 hypothetical protein COCCADRAFT_96725 [Bipolaris zeicola 26-R-13]
MLLRIQHCAVTPVIVPFARNKNQKKRNQSQTQLTDTQSGIIFFFHHLPLLPIYSVQCTYHPPILIIILDDLVYLSKTLALRWQKKMRG